jgi:uncharacterized membrane protein YdbT with pleckstrin-like domain
MDTKQKLGIKVFYYYLSRRISVGFLLLIVSFIFSISQNSIISTISSFIPSSFSTPVFGYFVMGLFAISILWIILGIFMSWLDYISCTFSLDSDSFDISRGIFNKKEVSISYRQIQDIDIEQTFYNKMFGVSRLVVLTAGNDDKDKEDESEGIFEVIDANLAEDLRKHILEKTSVQTVRSVGNQN